MIAEAPVSINQPRSLGDQELLSKPTDTLLTQPAQFLDIRPDFKSEVEEVEYYTTVFCTRAGLQKEELTRNNLNPVLDYVNWLRFLRRNPTEQQVMRYKDYLVNGQLQTGLRERNYAAKSAIRYLIAESGQVYNDRFPDEPFEDLLTRGLEYSRKNNSPELKRDEADVQGWINAINFLKDDSTPIGAKAINVSGPGIVEGTHHRDNFVDIYEKLFDPKTGKSYIRMTRNASDLAYSRYREIALQKDPHYFEGFTGPEDAWFVEHILKIDPSMDSRGVEEIFTEDFGLRKGAMKEDQFERIFQAALPIILHYVRVLCSAVDPLEIIRALQAVLVKNDLAVATEKESSQTFIMFGKSGMFGSTATFSLGNKQFKDIEAEVAWLVTQQTKAVGVACGVSSGFSIFGEAVTTAFKNAGLGGYADYLGISNSVGKFGIGMSSRLSAEEAKKDPSLCRCGQADGPHFHCSGTKGGNSCNHAIEVGKGIDQCPRCGAGRVC